MSDSVLLLFGGKISRGGLVRFPFLRVSESAMICWFLFASYLQDGHLKMLGGYLEFFMKPGLAETYLSLKREFEELIHCKVMLGSFCSTAF